MYCFAVKKIISSGLKLFVCLPLFATVLLAVPNAHADQKLQISKTGPATVERGGTVTYTITTTNTSNKTLTKSWVSDMFLNGDAYLTYLPGQSTPGCALQSGGRWVVCPPDKQGRYAPHETKVFNLTYSVPSHIPCNTVVIDQADVYADGSSPDWAKFSTKVTCPQPTPTVTPTPKPKTQCSDYIDNDGDGWIDLDDSCCKSPYENDEGYCNKPKIEISKTGASEIYQGDVIIYTITITNTSNFAANNVQVFDQIISGTGLTFLQDQSSTGCKLEGQYYVCPKTSLAAHESKSYELAFKVTSSAACGSQVMDQADVQVNGQSVDWAKFTTKIKCQVTSPVLPISECVYNLGNGNYRAYFGYENTGSQPITIQAGTNNADQVNAFSPGNANRGQPSVFETGRKTAVFAVDFAGESLTWNVKPQYGELKSITVSKTSKACKPVKPIAECRDKKSNYKFLTYFGYQNDNPFEISLKIPEENSFSPAPEDRAQPKTFFKGRVKNAFSVHSESDLTWKLATESATANNYLPLCTPNTGPSCNITAAPSVACQGNQTRVPLDGSQSSDPESSALTYQWTTDCVGAVFSDANAVSPDLIVDTSNGQARTCSVSLVVNDGVTNSSTCKQTIKISACNTDCAGNPNGNAKPDLCGVCNGNNACVDCAGTVNGSAKVDKCGVCGGNNSCVDCAGTPNGPAVKDKCGVCNGDGKSCLECTTTDIKDKLLALDIAVNQLRQLIIRLTNRLQSVSDNDPKYDKLVQDARKEAEVLYQQTWVLVWTEFRSVIVNCTDSSVCQESDNSASISAYTTASTRLRDIALGLLRQIQNLRDKKDKPKVARDKQLVQQANQIFTESAGQLAAIPRFSSKCP